MRDTGTTSLSQLSEEFGGIIARAAPALGIARTDTGPVCGFVWSPGIFLTAPRVTADTEVIFASGAAVGARPLPIVEEAGFAALEVTASGHKPDPIGRAEAPVHLGSLVLVVGAAPDAAPTVQLMMVSRINVDEARLDRPLDPMAEGGPVLDGEGRLLGMALLRPEGPILLANAAIARALAQRGWIGVAFQPTLVPVILREEARQDSGRRVIRTSRGGPAERAGLVPGDIVLSLDGVAMTGTGSLRGFLARTPPGREIVARVVRNGRIEQRALLVEVDPGGV